MRMRGALKVSVALLGATGLAGLAAIPSDANPTPAAPAIRTDGASAMTQETYIQTIRALLSGQPGDAQTDTSLVDGGKSICADIDGGATYATFLDQMSEYDLNRAVYRIIIRSSVLTFCPEHSDLLP